MGPIPKSDIEKEIANELTFTAAVTALERHAGSFRNLYGPQGKTKMAEGRDLTAIRYCIGTGGALTGLENGIEIMKKMITQSQGNKLYPRTGISLLQFSENAIIDSRG